MAKVLKGIAVVAAIAVNVIPGVGQLLSATVIGSLSGTLIAATTLAGIAAASSFLQRKPRQEATGITGRLQLSDQVDHWIAVGETAMPSQMIYWGTGGGENKELSIIIAHACHTISSFTGLAINGISTSYPTPSGGYAGILSIQTAVGSHTTNPFTGVQGPWSGSSVGRDLAMSHFRWTFDQEKLQSGLPQNIQFTCKGIAVYDPRRDSTRGGSGTMRADDQTTWAYEVGGTQLGNNPALVHLSYLLGWKKNGLLWAGKGESPSDINFADYIAAANICDELVSGQRRYTINGLISLAELHNVNEGRILACCAGKPTNAGGLLGMWAAHDDTAVPLTSFAAGDIMADIKWEPLPEGQTRNTARGSFVDPANGWTAQPYQEVAPSDLLTLDNGVELVDRLDFPMVTNANQARRLAGIRIRESRQGVYNVPLRLKALGLQAAKVFTQTLAQQGWTAKKFRVEAMTLEGETVTVRARAVAAGDYVDAGPSTLTPVTPPNTVGYAPSFDDGADVTRDTAPDLPAGNWASGVDIAKGTMIFDANALWVARVDHTSSSGNRPGVDATTWRTWNPSPDAGAVGSTASASFNSGIISSTSYAGGYVTIAVKAGAGGIVDLAVLGIVSLETGTSTSAAVKIQRETSPGTWADVGSEATSATVTTGTPVADFSMTRQSNGLTAGTSYNFRVLARRASGAGGSEVLVDGQLTGTGR